MTTLHFGFPAPYISFYVSKSCCHRLWTLYCETTRRHSKVPKGSKTMFSFTNLLLTLLVLTILALHWHKLTSVGIHIQTDPDPSTQTHTHRPQHKVPANWHGYRVHCLNIISSICSSIVPLLLLCPCGTQCLWGVCPQSPLCWLKTEEQALKRWTHGYCS